jgi:hypothetical protein
MSGTNTKLSLDNISVAAPCSAEWAKMSGDERVRHCALCRKNVYNLSEMSRTEAEALIREKEGSLCVRFYQRADGTILTTNCPVGLRAIQRRLRWICTGVAALFALCAGGAWARSAAGVNGLNGALRSKPIVNKLQDIQPFKAVIDLLDPQIPRMVMGSVCPPRTTPTPPPSQNPSPGN